MVRVKRQPVRGDLSDKAISRPTKSKQRSEEYLKYKSYIRSKEFKVVKDIVHKRDNDTCQTCGRTKEEIDANPKLSFNVHHRSYTHLFEGGEVEAADCILLCSCCHRGIHSVKSNLRRFKREKEPDA